MRDRATLARLQRAQESKRQADQRYRLALLACRQAGWSYTELAAELGVSKQAVREQAMRAADELGIELPMRASRD
jgi:DNA-directed RNA polymerase specialized sigma24 family protein